MTNELLNIRRYEEEYINSLSQDARDMFDATTHNEPTSFALSLSGTIELEQFFKAIEDKLKLSTEQKGAIKQFLKDYLPEITLDSGVGASSEGVDGTILVSGDFGDIGQASDSLFVNIEIDNDDPLSTNESRQFEFKDIGLHTEGSIGDIEGGGEAAGGDVSGNFVQLKMAA